MSKAAAAPHKQRAGAAAPAPEAAGPAGSNKVQPMRGTRPKSARGAELYETEPEAVEALLTQWPDYFARPRRIFEPSCGPGAMVAALQAAGHLLVASDLRNYEKRWKGDNSTPRRWGKDFLSWAPGHPFIGEPDAVVMNPPYSMADLHVWHALKFAPRVFALLELSWLAGTTRDCPLRAQMIDGGHLVALHPFRNRLKMHADGFTGPRNKTARLHCWFVLEREPSRVMASVLRRVSVPRKGNAHG